MKKKPWFPRKNDSEKVDVSQIGKVAEEDVKKYKPVVSTKK